MSDVVVTVPKKVWLEWLKEGDCAGTPETDRQYYFSTTGHPKIEPGERVYIVAYGKLRGYAPLFRLDWSAMDRASDLIRKGGAVAVTIPEPIPGFRGYRYRWWEREDEIPFPLWKVP